MRNRPISSSVTSDPDKPADIRGVTDIAPADVATAIKFCKKAATGSRRAMFELGRAYAANNQTADAIAIWRKAADKGSTSAMVELGVLYGTGAAIAREEAARKLFERAAQGGNPRGFSNLSALGGAGTPADPVRARELPQKAAETNAEAQYQLGLMLAEGKGGPQGRRRCACSVREGGRTKSSGRAVQMGAFTQEGRGGAKDKKAARPITSGRLLSATKTPRRRWSACAVPMRSRTNAETASPISVSRRGDSAGQAISCNRRRDCGRPDRSGRENADASLRRAQRRARSNPTSPCPD